MRAPWRWRRRWLAALAVVAALGGHVAWWYLPRERSARPRPSDAPARLLASWPAGTSLWLPFPHQNLGRLRRLEGGGPGLEAAARLTGIAVPDLPAFGPFAAPPSRELALAVDPDGGRLAVAARVYPLVAATARLGGLLARNPWLAGGEARWGGRAAQVSWRGTLWQVRVGEGAETGSEDAGGAWAGALEGPALAWLRLAEGRAPFPAGSYRLAREADSLTLTTGQLGPETLEPAPGAALQIVTASAALGAVGAVGAGSLLLWPGEGQGLPGVAVLHAPGSRSWELPGGDLLDLVGHDQRSVVDGWLIEALDPESLARAVAAAGAVRALLREGEAPVLLGVWIAPAGALREVRRVRAAVEAFPLSGRRERQRWRDLEALLAPLRRWGAVSLVVRGGEGSVALRLAGESAGESFDSPGGMP